MNKLTVSLLATLLVMVVYGCSTENDGRIVKELDQQKGIESFVVGDSLYPLFQRQIRSEGGTVEYSLLNNVITPYQEIDPPQRFLFGLEVKQVRARSNGGRISGITIRLGDLTPNQQQKVADSLTNRYGQPTASKDTIPSGGLNIKIRRWKGKRVWLQEVKRTENSDSADAQRFVALSVIDKNVIQETSRLKQEADSLLRARSAESMKQVGEFPFFSTLKHPMIKVEKRESSLADSTVASYTVPYEYLEDFFGLSNPMRPTQEERVITTNAYFDEQTDSLRSLIVSIHGDKHDPDARGFLDKSEYEGADQVTDILGKKLGDPHLIIRHRTIPRREEKIEEKTLRYWYHHPILIVQQPSLGVLGGYSEGVRITFSRVEVGNLLDKTRKSIWPDSLLHHG